MDALIEIRRVSLREVLRVRRVMKVPRLVMLFYRMNPKMTFVAACRFVILFTRCMLEVP